MLETHLERRFWSRFIMIAIAIVPAGLQASAVASEETDEQKYVVSVERIWDRPAHAAFTDIIALGDYLYCTFREGSGHVPGFNGVVRVIQIGRAHV